LTFGEFWTLTPADVLLAVNAHERRERSAYWRAGVIASAVINANPYRKKGTRAAKPEDFVPGKRRPQPQTPEQMAAKLRAMTVVMGGQVIDSTAGGSHAQP
jgi:hypothetical protein